MTLEDLKTFDVRQGHQTYQCQLDVFGFRRRWHKWRDRRQTERDRIDQGIKEERRAEDAMAEWLSRKSDSNPMTHDELVELLKAVIRSRDKS